VQPFDPTFLLFVPGDRTDRFAKAVGSAASGAIIDLEDAVAPEGKARARVATAAFLDASHDVSRVAVRINGAGTQWFDDDLDALHGVPLGAVVVPKAASAETLDTVASALGGAPIVAIIESSAGVVALEEIAANEHCAALAFGPYDLAADLGGTHEWDAMLPHRARLLVAARAFGRLAIDGPTAAFDDPALVAREAADAARLGYDGKLLIHPMQIEVARAAFRPSDEQLAHAQRVLAAAEHAMPAVLDGAMIDEPMLAAARRVVARGRSKQIRSLP
jgi:citrate lyase subunit beta/citryl-CoA lyase